MENNNGPKGIKAILLGESGVGKTNLINVAIGSPFDDNSNTTYCNSFVEKYFEINNKKYLLNIWDTIGQEQFRPLTRIFFKDSKIVIFVYDKSLRKSFDELNYWISEVKKLLGNDIIIAIVGNKADLDESDEDVDENEARQFAISMNAKFKMTSAKMNGKGFISFLKELLIDYINKSNGNINKENNGIVIDTESHRRTKKNKRDKCC